MSEMTTCQRWQAPNFEFNSNANPNVVNSPSTSNTVEQQQQIQQHAYDAGFEKGVRDGLLAGQEKVHQQAQYLQSVMQHLANPLQAIDDQVINELVELAMAAVRQMVRRELKISPGEVVGVVREALAVLPLAAVDVHIELHPDDAAIVRDALGGQETERSWKIVEEPVLSRGGCRVITQTSQIDATVENRLNAVIAAVMGGERFVD